MASRVIPAATPTITAATSSTTTTSSNGVGTYTAGSVQVTLTTGASALVTINCENYNIPAGTTAFTSFAVSGATTIASSDERSTRTYASTSGYLTGVKGSGSFVLTNLNPGTNTFTMHHRSTSTNAYTIGSREITVISLS